MSLEKVGCSINRLMAAASFTVTASIIIAIECMHHVLLVHHPFPCRLFITVSQARPFHPFTASSFCPVIGNLQIRVILIREWLVGCIFHLLVVLLKQSLVDLHGWRSKGDTSNEVL